MTTIDCLKKAGKFARAMSVFSVFYIFSYAPATRLKFGADPVLSPGGYSIEIPIDYEDCSIGGYHFVERLYEVDFNNRFSVLRWHSKLWNVERGIDLNCFFRVQNRIAAGFPN